MELNILTLRKSINKAYLKVRPNRTQFETIYTAIIKKGIVIERDRINKAPELMIGFSADLHLTEKCKAIEYRISENTNFDLTEAIVKAKEFYQSKKGHFFKQ
jgi:uncharacterized protein with von Willebrand factor type A (vWA) domain